MNKTFKHLMCACAVLALLGACDRPVNRVKHGLPMPIQTFEHVERLDVAVNNVRIEGNIANVGRRSGDFAVPFYDQAMSYLSHKFDAQGYGEQYLSVMVERADVRHVQKQSKHMVFSKICVDRVDEYLIDLHVRIEHRDVAGLVLAGEMVKVQKRFSVSEHDSPAAREQKQYLAVEEVFKLLDPQMNRIIRETMKL